MGALRKNPDFSDHLRETTARPFRLLGMRRSFAFVAIPMMTVLLAAIVALEGSRQRNAHSAILAADGSRKPGSAVMIRVAQTNPAFAPPLEVQGIDPQMIHEARRGIDERMILPGDVEIDPQLLVPAPQIATP